MEVFPDVRIEPFGHVKEIPQAAYSIPKNQQINSIFNEKNPISPFIDKVLHFFDIFYCLYISERNS